MVSNTSLMDAAISHLSRFPGNELSGLQTLQASRPPVLFGRAQCPSVNQLFKRLLLSDLLDSADLMSPIALI